MNSAAILAAAFPALLIVGVLLAPVLARRNRSARRDTGRDLAPERNGQPEDYKSPDVRPASADSGDWYFAKWSALQAKFNEPPTEGNDLITEAF